MSRDGYSNGAGDNDDMGGEFGMDISDSESDEQPGLKPQPEQPDSKWFDGERSELDGEQPGSDGEQPGLDDEQPRSDGEQPGSNGEQSESDGEQFDGEQSHEDSDDE